MFSALAALMLLPLFGSACAFGEPVSVRYISTQVSGTEWQYDYHLTGTFADGDDLAVSFPFTSSSQLSDLKTGGPDWSTYVLQPDPMLPADGEFDIVSNRSNPNLADTFSVQFIYSGGEAPATQAFTLYNASFGQLETGFTDALAPPPVPEPSSLTLLGSGTLALCGLLRFRKS